MNSWSAMSICSLKCDGSRWSNLSVRSVAYAGLTLAGYSVVDRVSRRSGVTDAEFNGSLPGDGVLPHSMIEWTRATTIGAPPKDVWPWLVQMGFGRGGWYTSERFDRIVWRLENLSAGQILPEWQDLQVGDIVPDGPDYAAYFRVVEVQPEEAIVYRSIRHPYRGHPVDPTDSEGLVRLEEALIEAGTYLDFSWAWVIRPIGRDACRLLVRTRANCEPRLLSLVKVPLGLVDWYHVSTMFRGIEKRVAAPI